MSATHEDIRYKVLSTLRNSISNAVDHIRASKPHVYSKLRQQLEEYRKLIDRREDIPLIIKNEKIIKDIGIPDIEVFGGRILIEVKVKPSEFEDGFDQLSKYVEFYPYGEYAILTNYESWIFYKVKNGKLAKARRMSLVYIIEEILVKQLKVPLSTENVRNMFKPMIPLESGLHRIFENYKVRESALFEAYLNIMNRLYEQASDEETEKLFIKHTLMQMIVSACLAISSQRETTARRACSGADIEAEIVLPYLKWWQSLNETPEHEKFLISLVESVYSRAMLLDWESGGEDDVFRELYEILIDTETRRKIGEYYTPLWLVEYMTEELSKDIEGLRGKTVLDPFCGSGTFLVTAFYRKVQEGEDADDAIKEVIGFDINPLAVSIARAELMIAYQSKRKGIVTPLVFNIDSAGLLLHKQGEWVASSFLDELREIEKKIEYIDSPIYSSNEIDFSEILKVEVILRDSFREMTGSADSRRSLETRLGRLKDQELKGSLTSLIVETLAEERILGNISRLIEKYGNGVWAVSITSLFAPHIIRKVKVDTVITNPPWALLTEPKGSYGKLLRDKAKDFLGDYEKTGQILAGSDISSVLLRGGINIAKKAVAYVMPEQVVYTAGSVYGLGRLLTYSVVKGYEGEAVQIGFDAFQHGRYPSMIFLRKEAGETACYSMQVSWTGEYSKTLHLSDVECKTKKDEGYRDYVKGVAAYVETSSESIKRDLDVEEVVPMGDYIRGLFGGVKKKGAKKYAGLVFRVVAKDKTAGQYTIQLSQTETKIRTPEYFLNPYWKKLIYVGDVFPFYLNHVHDVLLSSAGKDDLKEFLEKQILRTIPTEPDKDKVETLIEEMKQPEDVRLLKTDKHHIVYRCDRTFASFVLTPEDIKSISSDGTHGTVIESHCSFMRMENEEKAYFYSSVLNYLVYKVIESNGAFVRHQFLRPLIAILHAGLEWRDEPWQVEVAQLGKKLHMKASKCLFSLIRRGMQVKNCFDRLETCDETRGLFEQLVEIVDNYVDEKKLYESLRLVCRLT